MSLTEQGQMPRVKEEPEIPSLLMFYKPETEVVALVHHSQYILLSDTGGTFATAVIFSISSFHICVRNYSSFPALGCVAQYSHDLKLRYQKLVPLHLLPVAPALQHLSPRSPDPPHCFLHSWHPHL